MLTRQLGPGVVGHGSLGLWQLGARCAAESVYDVSSGPALGPVSRWVIRSTRNGKASTERRRVLERP
jgi:hypothetical protein